MYYTYSNPAKEERVARKLLFNPMEVFLCSGDPEDMFQQLKGLDRPSQICGHVFKMGEPTYCCRWVALIQNMWIIQIGQPIQILMNSPFVENGHMCKSGARF